MTNLQSKIQKLDKKRGKLFYITLPTGEVISKQIPVGIKTPLKDQLKELKKIPTIDLPLESDEKNND